MAGLLTFLKGVAATVGAGLMFLGGLFGAQPASYSGTGIIPKTAAWVETYLTAPMQTTDTSFTLASNKTLANTVLQNGYYSFVVDQGTPQQEIVEGTASGTSVTGVVRGIDPQNPNTTSSALIFVHQRGADIKITEYSWVGHVSNLLNGSDTFPNVIAYQSTSSALITAPGQIASKAYVDSVALAGAPAANPLTGTAGTTMFSTQSQLLNGTATSSYLGTTYYLHPYNAFFNATSSATTTVPVSVLNVQGANYGLSSSFVDQTAAYVWTGNSTFATGTTTFATSSNLVGNGTTTINGSLSLNGSISGSAYFSVVTSTIPITGWSSFNATSSAGSTSTAVTITASSAGKFEIVGNVSVGLVIPNAVYTLCSITLFYNNASTSAVVGGGTANNFGSQLNPTYAGSLNFFTSTTLAKNATSTFYFSAGSTSGSTGGTCNPSGNYNVLFLGSN